MEIILINEELFRENSPIKDDTIVTKFVPYMLYYIFNLHQTTTSGGLCVGYAAFTR